MKKSSLLAIALAFVLVFAACSGQPAASPEPSANDGTSDVSASPDASPAEPSDASPEPASPSPAEPSTAEPTAAEPPHWTYAGETGPEHWADLSPDWAIARDGKEQSPINIESASAKAASEGAAAEVHYVDTEFKIENNGHTIELVPATKDNYITIDGAKYTLAQAHFHAPSEHQIDGKAFDMEIHMVNKDDAGNIAVIGLVIKAGAENAALKEAFDAIATVSAADTESELAGKINLGSLIPADSKVFRYSGSLTTPPCSEGVKWSVYQNPIELSQDQIDAFKAVYNGNARPVQPLNEREVTLY